MTKNVKYLNSCNWESEINALAKYCMFMSDFKGNPGVATGAEMVKLVNQSYRS
jgi:hypothetical protein